jgi:hypothetical protein
MQECVWGMCALGGAFCWYAHESDRNYQCCHRFYLPIDYPMMDKLMIVLYAI